jgi:sulfatase modifying factor 1
MASGCGARTGLASLESSSGGSSGCSAGTRGGSSEGDSSSAGPLAPSCAQGGPGMATCGASGESCCTSLEVAGGTYFRTYTNSGSGPTGEADPASISCFKLDKYLATVGRFRQFVSAWNAGWLPSAGSGKHTHLNGGKGLADSGGTGTYEPGWVASDDFRIAPTNGNLACGASTWTIAAGSKENLPINCVNWYEAYAFCIWDGGFLPSEAEWEYAAAGGSQQREYPWGSADPGTSNQYAIDGCYYSNVGHCTGPADIAPVGTATLGAGRWGQLDLVGEVSEWTLDWWATYVNPCVDCSNLTNANGSRAFRGGFFSGDAAFLLPPTRGADDPTGRQDGWGLRCARSPQ